ncbi:hypothetical protein CEXT_329321 [Caerostris extrusa]|uniref:Uncharacterized protein n=1 Tax=Caerostris extrusa TaxID=172846 RepID=A0AAV4Y6U5_CAEEX|nr:hypothetical protein CEXT_329321 [Caerostris extrusa]
MSESGENNILRRRGFRRFHHAWRFGGEKVLTSAQHARTGLSLDESIGTTDCFSGFRYDMIDLTSRKRRVSFSFLLLHPFYRSECITFETVCHNPIRFGGWFNFFC